MFQFGGFPAIYYGFIYRSHGVTHVGFPHSDICGSLAICASPQLFAAYRVLLRLLMPRHSPCALLSLNFVPLIHCMSFANRFYFLLIAVYCCQYYFALSSEKPSFFTQYFTKLLITCFSARIYILHIYRVLDLLSPISLSLSPRQFVCRYNSTSFRLLSYIVIKKPYFVECTAYLYSHISARSSLRSVKLPGNSVHPFRFSGCELVADPACWWAQVDSLYALTYRVLIFSYKRLPVSTNRFAFWWAQVDSNYRPRAYQARALTN